MHAAGVHGRSTVLDSRAQPGETPILTPFDPPLVPATESRLESTVLHLENRGDYRNLICFAERWAAEGELTPRARVAVAKAFVELRMMDRAWIRLRDAVEEPHPTREALLLAARLFLMRGWPVKARAPLERALAEDPDDSELNTLWSLLDQPPITPDPTLAEGREADDLDAWLPLAEVYMAAGSFIKAQAILQRLSGLHPDNARVADLLWVLDGDFSTGPASLTSLAQRLGPSIADLSELADLPDEAEHTESVTPDELRAQFEQQTAPESGGAFPVLFRQPVEATTATSVHLEADEEPETTQRAELASVEQLRSAPPETGASPPPSHIAGDTRVMQVIHRVSGSEIVPVDGPVHKSVESYDSSFDLASFRREMGMSFPSGAPVSDFDQLEDEDEALIIVTRTQRDETDEVGAGFPQLELDPPTSEIGLIDNIVAEAATPAPLCHEDSPPPPPPRAPRAPQRRLHLSAMSWWLFSFGVLVVLFVVLLVGAVGLRVLSAWL